MAGLNQLRNAISSTFSHRNGLNRLTRDLRFVMRDSARSFLTEVEKHPQQSSSPYSFGYTSHAGNKMQKSLFVKNSMKMGVLHHPFFTSVREMHSRNKKAAEFIAKGRSALQEVDRVIDYADIQDQRLIPLLKAAKENFELALEADNLNTSARLMLSKLHLKYHVPGACKAIGAALLVEAADMGDANAQYELGVHLRTENDHVQSDQQAFYYIQKAVDQLHPGALYLLGAVYLTGDCVQKDVASALWCFHRASQKGHTGAAIAYGSLLLRGYEVPEKVTKFKTKKPYSKKTEIPMSNPIDLAKEQFEIAAKAGCDLGFKWLQRLDDEEKKLLAAQ